MKKRLILFSVPLLALLFVSGCKKENLCDCFKNTGSDIREDRAIGAFKEIQIEGKIDLVLTQDTTERIYVVAGKNLIDEIETSVNGGRLYIRDHSTCNFVRGYSRHKTVYASVHHLNTLFFESSGTVTATNTLQDSLFDVESIDGSGFVNLKVIEKVIYINLHTGPADIRVNGDAPLMYLYSGGNGVIHAESKACPQIYLTNRGTGDLYITSTADTSSILHAELTSTGYVYCSGRPAKLQKSESGTGRLIIQ
jgi:hypothetical protein